jgi:hypothetical protein
MADRADDEDGPNSEQENGGRIVDRTHREAIGKDAAEKDHWNIRREHAAGGAGDDGEEVRIAGGQRECCGRRKRVASNRDNNCVRSPISASATVEIETRKASIEGLQAERVTDHGGASAARAGGPTVGLAMPEGSVRHGLRQVC